MKQLIQAHYRSLLSCFQQQGNASKAGLLLRYLDQLKTKTEDLTFYRLWATQQLMPSSSFEEIELFFYSSCFSQETLKDADFTTLHTWIQQLLYRKKETEALEWLKKGAAIEGLKENNRHELDVLILEALAVVKDPRQSIELLLIISTQLELAAAQLQRIIKSLEQNNQQSLLEFFLFNPTICSKFKKTLSPYAAKQVEMSLKKAAFLMFKNPYP